MKKKSMRIIAIVLSILLVLGTVTVALISLTAGAAEVDELKNELSSISSEKDKLKKEYNAIKNKVQDELNRKSNIDQQIELIEREIELYNNLIARLDNEIAVKEQEIAKKTKEIEAQYEILKKRIRATYEEGTISYIDLLLSSDSYTSFLINMDIVSSILEQDEQLIRNMEILKAQIEESKVQIEANREKQSDTRNELKLRATDLDGKKRECQELIAVLDSDKAEAKAAFDKAAAEERAILAEIKALTASSDTEYVGGVFAWPAPGYKGVSDEFGMRMHPTLHVYKMHTGIDIKAPGGAKIVAANSGKVIKSSYNGAYGNYIVIDHGGKTLTLYAHMSKRISKVGDNVVKGKTVIGKVGTTGYSTGNHLHFEVIVNGKHQNPRNYIK